MIMNQKEQFLLWEDLKLINNNKILKLIINNKKDKMIMIKINKKIYNLIMIILKMEYVIWQHIKIIYL